MPSSGDNQEMGLRMEKTFNFNRPTKTSVVVDETGISISRKGVLNALNIGLIGSKGIPFTSITAIQLKEGTGLTNGYIQFSILGGKEQKGGVLAATQDENTIMFTKAQNDDAKELKALIESRIKAAQPASAPAASPVQQIKEMKELLDAGIITGEQFEMKKNEILGL